MNKYNKAKFNEVKSAEIDKKLFEYYVEQMSFKDKLPMFFGLIFRTRRSVLFLSCIHRGMSPESAHNVAYTNTIEHVAVVLDNHGWQISFGKLD